MSATLTGLNPTQLLAWSSEANRAPSVHNVQPARWSWKLTGADSASVTLYSDQTRRLHAGDPLRLDEGTSLGAAWEGLRLATARDGWRLDLEEWLDPGMSPVHPHEPDLKRVATGTITRAPAPEPRDDLTHFVFKRKAFRGKFAAAIPSQLNLLESALQGESTVMLRTPAQIALIARWVSEATARIAKHSGVQRELLQWLRFSPSDPRYHEDGLNAEALEIPRSVARLAGSALRFSSHPMVLKTGLNQVLIDETSQVRSSSAILILFVPANADAVTRGRRLYRTWLRLAQLGLAACPMSVLADDPETARTLKSFHVAPESVAVLNVFRVGVSPQPVLPLTPRLQPEKLVVL